MLSQLSALFLVLAPSATSLPHQLAGPTITRVGSQPAGSTTLRVDGVGSGAFDPSRFSSWHHDARFPLIAPKEGGTCPGNIYNANCVANGTCCSLWQWRECEREKEE